MNGRGASRIVQSFVRNGYDHVTHVAMNFDNRIYFHADFSGNVPSLRLYFPVPGTGRGALGNLAAVAGGPTTSGPAE